MIHIDGIIFSLQAHGGISVYFRELLQRLAADRVPTHVSMFPPLRTQADVLRRSSAVPAISWSESACRTLERYRRAPAWKSAHVFHSTYYRRSADPRVPTVVTVHDFAYERCVSGVKRWVHSAQKFAAIRAAQSIICISESTRDDLLEFVGLRPGQRLHVIYNGVGEQFRPLGAQPSANTLPFVLFVGVRGGYKNFDLLLKALALCPDVQLRCVGGGPLRADELAHVPASVGARVRHLGQVSDTRLNELYNEALCLAYPSAYEGFGIPVLEAMRAGCPVVSVACKAVLEVGRDALLVAEPSAEGLAAQLMAAGAERGRQSRERGLELSRGFSWERHYQQTVEVYRELGTN
jgi:mannosyltransferase